MEGPVAHNPAWLRYTASPSAMRQVQPCAGKPQCTGTDTNTTSAKSKSPSFRTISNILTHACHSQQALCHAEMHFKATSYASGSLGCDVYDTGDESTRFADWFQALAKQPSSQEHMEWHARLSC